MYEKQLRDIKRLQSYPLTKEQIEEFAWKETENDTYQACEAFVHNSNSMHSRGGGQVPFISINYGTDTSKEGRMLIKQLLKATQAGLGKGDTDFSDSNFQDEKGVNFEESDPELRFI